MSQLDAAGRHRVTRVTADGNVKNVWAETPRAEPDDLDLGEQTGPRHHPVTGDDLTKLYHGSKLAPLQVYLHGLTPRGAGTVSLTPDFTEALRSGGTVVQVDARDLDLDVVGKPGRYRYASLSAISPSLISEPDTTGFDDVLDPQARRDCVYFAAKYAAGPPNPHRYAPDWEKAHTKPTYELEVGDRVREGLVTRVIENGRSNIRVCVDGETDPSVALDFDAAVTVHDDAVDLSDPAWFRAETRRITRARVAEFRAAGLTVNRAQTHGIEDAVRDELTLVHRPGAFPARDNHPDACHSRARVGQDVVFDEPGHGPRTYRVTGKKHAGDDLGVEYILTDTRTGNQTTTDMRQVGWRYSDH